MRHRALCWVVALVGACGGGAAVQPDGSVEPDGAAPDGAPGDAPAPADGALPDGAPGDGGAVDGATLDAATAADAMPSADAAPTPPYIVSLIGGGVHTCALLNDGALRCFGIGGRLGLGHTDSIGDNELPSTAGFVDLGGPATLVGSGPLGNVTCAVTAGGLRCWGINNDYGECGYGHYLDIGDDETPASAGYVPVAGTVVQAAAANLHTCVLLDSGVVRCWGMGFYGELGYGNMDSNPDAALAGPVPIGGTVVQLAAGTNHTCALLDTGAVRCWGVGDDGQLGYGNVNHIGDNETAGTGGDVSIGGIAVQIAAGGWHSCALLAGGTVRCWGYNGGGELGLGHTNAIGDNELPSSAPVVDVGGTVVQIAAGSNQTCVLLATGTVRCWGFAGDGALGYANTIDIGDNESPSAAGDVDLGGQAVQLAAGAYHMCALLADATVRCWGYGFWGPLGYGSTANVGDNETPASVGPVAIL